MYKFITILFLVVVLLSCNDDGQIGVVQHNLSVPSSAPVINRTVLMTGVNYSTGYTNGNIQSRRATITWQPSSDATFLAYKIYKNNGLMKVIDKSTTGSFTDTTLAQNTYYKYMIASVLKQGTHRMDTVTIKTPRFEPPPLSFQIRPPKSIVISWSKTAESATQYTLDRSVNSGSFSRIASLTTLTYTDTNVQNLTTYTYRIQAFSPYESTAFSSSTIYYQYTMNAPNIFSIQQLSPERQVRFDWTDNSTGENVFRIYRRSTTSPFTLIDSVSANVTTFTDRDTNYLKFDSMYYYFVKGYNQVDTTPRSNVRSITITKQTSSLNEGFESGSIPINWSSSGNASWNISSASPYSGTYCVRSGAINNSQSSIIQTSLSFTGTKTISFYYKVSSEGCCDKLRFYINGSLYQTMGGEIGWTSYSLSYYGTGTVTLMWEYSKDGSIASGQDAAWIDNILVQ
ncbi:MAG: hypothetical protein HYZ34_00615 [Ignavibacteriae bacterium]|nr:hypothetical protein [Ignavibacteriota bacterium]